MDLTKLAYSQRGQGADGDVLKMLGKRAAKRFMSSDGGSLNDAVEETIREHGNLSPQSVRRVAEMANQTTWKETFSERGADARFEPANATQILEGLADRPEQSEAPIMDFLEDPPERAGDFSKLEEAFKVDEKSDLPAFDPNREVREEHEKAASAADLIAEGERRLSRMFQEAAEKTYQMVKQAHMAEGAGVLQMARAFSQVTEADEFAEDLVAGCVERMRSEGVSIDEREEMKKIAQAVVINNEHPLLAQVVTFEKVAVAYHQLCSAKRRADMKKAKSFRALKDKLRGA